jgi:D-alanyl-D-alanine dipeptidase
VVLVAAAHAAASGGAPLVDAAEVIPDLIVDLRYATSNNFLKRRLYPEGARCLLLATMADRLARAAERLRQRGFRIKVYDCYRPLSVQRQMWKVMPQPGYVADPRRGSNHNRGAAVDLTLADLDGSEVEMPTAFDTFDAAAHHGYAKAPPTAARNREILREAMEQAGLRKNRLEWWHYELPQAERLPILESPLALGRP